MRKLILVILLFTIKLCPQSIFEPVESGVYDFLERQSVRGVINFNTEIKPVLKSEIASKLIELDGRRDQLTGIDRELLKYYLIDYVHEVKILLKASEYDEEAKFLITGAGKRIRMFEYSGKNFSLFADPMLSVSYGSNYNENIFIRRNGLRAFGYAGNYWGYEFRFFDNEETTDLPDYDKFLSPERGIVITKKKPDSFEYDEVNASVVYSWGNGSIALGKDHFKIGSGRTGNIILSDKAPSFPFIRLDVKPAEWIRFFYFHGFLVSNVPDSATLRFNSVSGRTSIADVPKFMAFHLISFYPSDNLSISIGESIVYSEYIQPVYFIPVMFFRVADHYLGRTNSSASGNAQMFADISYKNTALRSRFYTSLFIDELSLNSIFKGGNLAATGVTAGTEIQDFPVDNSTLTMEYSRVNPFVYMNSVDAQVYSNENYKAGHWMESNGDIISLKYRQQILRYLSFDGGIWYMRKGKKELPDEQYSSPYPPFLYGGRRNETNINFSIVYNPFHPVYVKLNYSYRNISDEDNIRTPEKFRGRFDDFLISLSYGF
ncbi:MAG: capsule assembly Wzi family protein [Ignavibacteriaceae bacterium]